MVPDRERWWGDFWAFDAIRVFKVDISDLPDREMAALPFLDSGEMARWSGFARPDPKRRFALCRVALRSILCELLSCENLELSFAETDKGKPFALLNGEKPPLSFNVSHSGDYGLIAVGNVSMLGVDIEFRRQRRDLQMLTEAVMTSIEQANIETIEDVEARYDLFFDYWTVKEAILKAVGVGMSGPDPKLIEVPESIRKGSRSCIAQFPRLTRGRFRIVNLGTSEFAASLAYMVDET